MSVPEWAITIRERRKQIGLSQAEIAEASELLNQTEVSRLERGLVHPTLDLGAAKLQALLRVLHWSWTDFVRQTGLELDFGMGFERLEVSPQFATFAVHGKVSAGTQDAQPTEGLVSIPLEDLRALGVRPENIRVYVVNGDCMVSEGVRGTGHSIVPGDRVAVDTGRIPKEGDVVVAWDGLNEVLLIKRFREEGEHVVFYPARYGVPPVVRHRDDPVRIVGPVVWRGGLFRG